jgi:hypothetical protein
MHGHRYVVQGYKCMTQYKQPTKCNLVIEFIIPPFIEGLTCFERHSTRVCKPEAANIVRVPDDERYTARNMFSLQ